MPSVFTIDHVHPVPSRELAGLLGGKGAGLSEMTNTLGLDVPPGFTLTVPTCVEYLASGWPAGLDDEIRDHVRRLGDRMGRHLGDPADPLLVAVRSGAPVSMPGMLDTVLNLGLNEESVAGLAKQSHDERFAWDSYRRFLSMFAVTVMGVDAAALPQADPDAGAEGLRTHCAVLAAAIETEAGRPVPQDPHEQLDQAVRAVFDSWTCDRARIYRTREGIDDNLGTAVTVQAMVFGNRGHRSGTGVVFTRDPATGHPGPYGDYLPRAQGEAVVSGGERPMPIARMEELHPEAYAELVQVLRRLEIHYRDVCDVEFTVEDGRLWLLQTRIGKRGATAAVRIAVALVDDPDIALSPEEALDRVPEALRRKARAEVAAGGSGGAGDEDLLAHGLGASPGRVSGRIALTALEALEAEDDVILVRRETNPEDVAGMAASVGVLTTKGGLVSHAAVVARGWGIPAVVGTDDLTIEPSGLRCTDGRLVSQHDVITIDGQSGCVWLGVVAGSQDDESAVDVRLPELRRLEGWAMSRERTPA